MVFYTSGQVFAAESSGVKWVLIETNVNPDDRPLEGGVVGATVPHRTMTVSENRFTSRYTETRQGTLLGDVSWEATFDSPPKELIAGEAITLTAQGSATGDPWGGIGRRGGSLSYYYAIKANGGYESNSSTIYFKEDNQQDSLSITFTIPEEGNYNGKYKITAVSARCGPCEVTWIYTAEVEAEPEYGVIERDGKLYLVSPPYGPLIISRSDLPEWARDQIVTVRALIAAVGPPDHVVTGDNNVLLDGLPVARVGDITATGGTILQGSTRIFVNGEPAAFVGAYAVNPMITNLVPRVGGVILTSGETDIEGFQPYYTEPISELEVDAHRGQIRLMVREDVFEVGDTVIIGNGEADDVSEAARVAEIGSIILDRPLKNSYPAGTLVTRVPDEYADLVPPAPGGVAAVGTPSASDSIVEDSEGIAKTTIMVLIVLLSAFVFVILLIKKVIRFGVKIVLILLFILLVAFGVMFFSGGEKAEPTTTSISPTSPPVIVPVTPKPTSPPTTLLTTAPPATLPETAPPPQTTLPPETTPPTTTVQTPAPTLPPTTTSTMITTTSTTTSTTTTTEPKPILELVDETIVDNVEDKFWLGGKVRNNGETDALLVRVRITLYNEMHAVLQTLNSVPIDRIGPGETVEFNTIKSDKITTAVARYEVTIHTGE